MQSLVSGLPVLLALPCVAHSTSQATTTRAAIAAPGSLDDLAQASSCSGGWARTFASQLRTNDPVRAFAEHDDGKSRSVYVGGWFTSVGGVAGVPVVNANRVARWDGSDWAPLGSGVSGTVEALAVFDDGSGPALHAGGFFGQAGGSFASRIAKWDGSAWTPLGSGMSGGGLNMAVYALAAFDDGSGPALYAGGLFTSAGGVPAQNIARWDGTSWTPLGTGTSARVLALTVFDGGSGGGPALYAGGAFPAAGGETVNFVARWDGAQWSPLGSGMNGRVEELAAIDAGTPGGPALFAGGGFTSAGGIAASYVARWDGSSWEPLGDGMYEEVEAMTVLDDGSGEGPALYVAGCTPPGGGGCVNPGVLRWDGSSWSRLGPYGNAYELAGFEGDEGPELFVGDQSIARWTPRGWSPPAFALDDTVASLAVFDDGSEEGPALHAGGDFHAIGDQYANRLASWDGAGWTARAQATGFPLAGTITAQAVFDDLAGGGPALHVGNTVTTFQGTAVANVARRDGSLWVPLGSGMSNSSGGAAVSALEVFDEGSGPALFAGGQFATADGVPVGHIARWDGTGWSAVGGGITSVPGAVLALAVFDDGGGAGPALYAGGVFVSAGGVPANRIARWDGAQWSALGSGLPQAVGALAVFDDGGGPALYAGGSFQNAGGIPVNHVARWDGASWTALAAGVNDDVGVLAVFDDGSGAALYAAGLFTSASGIPARSIARWNGTSWAALGAGLPSSVRALEVFDDGDGAGPALYAGGSFMESPGGDPFLARWIGCPDADPPVLACPDAIHVDDPGPPGEIVTFAVTASDRDPHATIVCEPPTGSFFRRGTTLVRCTATDGSGNRSSCAFPVTVQTPRVRVR